MSYNNITAVNRETKFERLRRQTCCFKIVFNNLVVVLPMFR